MVKGKKNDDVVCYMLTLSVSLEQGNVKKSDRLMKIDNIEENNLHILWTTWQIMMIYVILNVNSPYRIQTVCYGDKYLAPPALNKDYWQRQSVLTVKTEYNLEELQQ